MSGVIISIEGINGVGKSHFEQELRKEMQLMTLYFLAKFQIELETVLIQNY